MFLYLGYMNWFSPLVLLFITTSISALKMKSISPLYTPKTPNQLLYSESLDNTEKTMTVALGPAGSGKTLLACVHAISSLKRGEIRKIVLTRPLVSVEEEEIGFLPGNLVTKMDPWTKPMFDIFKEFYSVSDLNNLVKLGVIEVAPLAFMRGRTFHRSFVLADEMQNASPSQMMMLATRMGQESKLVVTGDLNQSDRYENNGLSHFLGRFDDYRYTHGDEKALKYIDVIEMDNRDICRSPFVSSILDILGET
jgi:phosphate starvation-inducible protein PhoH and related proteins